MGGPINVGGVFWHQTDDGTWFKWNAAAAAWQPSDAPPPAPTAPEPPAPEPPPPPPTADAPVAAGSKGPDVTPPTGLPPVGLSASRDVVAAPRRRGAALSPIVLLVAGMVLVGAAAAAFITLTGSDDDPTVSSAPSAPVTSAPPGPGAPGAAVISPRNERNIYSVLRNLQGCFGPETLAWAGELRAGALDRAGLEDDIARISSNLEDLRSRRFPDPVDVKIVPRARVGELAAELSAAEINTRDSKIDEQILVALGILPRGTDLEELGRKVISEGVAGFYVPATKKLFAGVGPAGFVPFDEIILAHELDHTLMDATLGLPDLVTDDLAESDRIEAHRAAIEGDATLTMIHYAIASFDPSEWQELLADPSQAGAVDTEAVPYVLQKSLAFPYTEGLLFACDMFSRGKWKSVERALRNPPTSTAQILFPDRYLRQTEVVDAPDPTTPPGWTDTRVMSLGAADLLWMVQASRDVPLPQSAAGIEDVRGWAGGELHAWEKEGDIALQITLVDGGVDRKGTVEIRSLCNTLQDWYQNQFDKAKLVPNAVNLWRNGDSFASLGCVDNIVRLAIAPDRTTAETLVPNE